MRNLSSNEKHLQWKIFIIPKKFAKFAINILKYTLIKNLK